jgi:hypothetical protein
MGKRSGFPHSDAELQRLRLADLQTELARLKIGREIASSSKMKKLWQKGIYAVEAEIERRT